MSWSITISKKERCLNNLKGLDRQLTQYVYEAIPKRVIQRSSKYFYVNLNPISFFCDSIDILDLSLEKEINITLKLEKFKDFALKNNLFYTYFTLYHNHIIL